MSYASKVNESATGKIHMNLIQFTNDNGCPCGINPYDVSGVNQCFDVGDGPNCDIMLRGGKGVAVRGTYDEVVAALSSAAATYPDREQVPCPNGCNDGEPISPCGGVGNINYHHCDICGKTFKNP
jgi:hypothetical protein